jgi:hypothetical protein
MAAGALRERLGVSPATLMRAVRAAGPKLLRLGRARASSYALAGAWPNLPTSRFPIIRVSEGGQAEDAVFFTADSRLRLAPAFDQVSTLYEPTPDGQVPDRIFVMPRISADTLDVWDEARQAAGAFWATGAEDPRLSDGIRVICGRNARLLAA